MVGRYYKMREERSKNKFLQLASKWLFIALALLCVVFLAIVFFFNGERVKYPVASYLSRIMGAEVKIGTADFSPLYPNVIRLIDVTFGESKVHELYVEYDIFSMGSDELVLNDLYINGMTLADADLKNLKNNSLGFKQVQAKNIRLNHIPMHLANLKSDDLTLRLEDVIYNKDSMSFSYGRINALEGELFGEAVKSLNLEFEKADQGFFIKNMSLNILGGTISGTGMFYPTDLEDLLSDAPQNLYANALASTQTDKLAQYKSSPIAQMNGEQQVNATTLCDYASGLRALQSSAGHFDFSELYLTNIIIPSCLTVPGNIDLTAEKAVLSDVIVTNQLLNNIDTGADNQEKVSAAQASKDAAANIKKVENEVITPVSTSTESQTNKDQPSTYSSFVLQGITGQFTNLSLNQGRLLGSFKGNINELSLPSLQTQFIQNQTIARFGENNLSFELQGQVYEGEYTVRGKYTPEKSLIVIDNLGLTNNKLELTKERSEFLQKGLTTYQVKLGSMSFSNLEFLSYINSLPVSIQSISGNAADWQFNNPQRKTTAILQDPEILSTNHKAEGTELLQALQQGIVSTPSTLSTNKGRTKNKLRFNIEGDPAALLNLELTNVLYSDLRIRNAQCIVTLSDDIVNISLPTVHFNESALSAQATLGLVESNANSYFILNARDFEIADLNSNLINHMLTGKVNLNVTLKSNHDSLDQAWENLEGKISLSSDAMLISELGLDLINGGPNKNYTLSGTELMTAIQGSVAGINNLAIDASFDNHEATVKGKMDLATGHTEFEGILNLANDITTGTALLTSSAQDSMTRVHLDGTLQEPKFSIIAIKRGEARPGLYLPQYEGSVRAKEPTDTIVHGFENSTSDTNATNGTKDTKETNDQNNEGQSSLSETEVTSQAEDSVSSNTDTAADAATNSNINNATNDAATNVVSDNDASTNDATNAATNDEATTNADTDSNTATPASSDGNAKAQDVNAETNTDASTVPASNDNTNNVTATPNEADSTTTDTVTSTNTSNLAANSETNTATDSESNNAANSEATGTVSNTDAQSTTNSTEANAPNLSSTTTSEAETNSNTGTDTTNVDTSDTAASNNADKRIDTNAQEQSASQDSTQDGAQADAQDAPNNSNPTGNEQGSAVNKQGDLNTTNQANSTLTTKTDTSETTLEQDQTVAALENTDSSAANAAATDNTALPDNAVSTGNTASTDNTALTDNQAPSDASTTSTTGAEISENTVSDNETTDETNAVNTEGTANTNENQLTNTKGVTSDGVTSDPDVTTDANSQETSSENNEDTSNASQPGTAADSRNTPANTESTTTDNAQNVAGNTTQSTQDTASPDKDAAKNVVSEEESEKESEAEPETALSDEINPAIATSQDSSKSDSPETTDPQSQKTDMSAEPSTTKLEAEATENANDTDSPENSTNSLSDTSGDNTVNNTIDSNSDSTSPANSDSLSDVSVNSAKESTLGQEAQTEQNAANANTNEPETETTSNEPAPQIEDGASLESNSDTASTQNEIKTDENANTEAKAEVKAAANNKTANTIDANSQNTDASDKQAQTSVQESEQNTSTNESIAESLAPSTSETQSTEDLKKQADKIEESLLEQAAFDSFFNFRDPELEDAERKESSKSSRDSINFSFDNDDDELIF